MIHSLLSRMNFYIHDNLFIRIYNSHYQLEWIYLLLLCFGCDTFQVLPVLTCVTLWLQIILCFLGKSYLLGVEYTQVFFTLQHVIGHMICHAGFAMASFCLYNAYQRFFNGWIRNLRKRNALLNAKEYIFIQEEFAKTKQAVKESFPFPEMHNFVCDFIRPSNKELYTISIFERNTVRLIFFTLYCILGFYFISNAGDSLGYVLESISPYLIENEVIITTFSKASISAENMTVQEKLNAILKLSNSQKSEKSVMFIYYM